MITVLSMEFTFSAAMPDFDPDKLAYHLSERMSYDDLLRFAYEELSEYLSDLKLDSIHEFNEIANQFYND